MSWIFIPVDELLHLAIAAKMVFIFSMCFGLRGHICPRIKRFAYQLTGILTTYLGWCKKKHKLDRKYFLAMGYNVSKGTASTAMVEIDGDNQTQNYMYEDTL